MWTTSARRNTLATAAVLLAAVTEPAAGDEAASVTPPPYRAAVEAALGDAVFTGWLVGGDRPDRLAGAARFYRERRWDLAWVRDGAPTAQALALAQLLARAEERGLEPEDSAGPRWRDRLGALRRDTPPQEQARLDAALTLAGLRYVADVQWGRLGADPIRWRLDRNEPRPDPARALERIAAAPDVGASIAAGEPSFPAYAQTLRALERYRRLAREERGAPIHVPRDGVRPGDAWDGVGPLAALLLRISDLPASAASPRRDVYEGDLVSAVQRFQRRHGLEPDGVIGADTARHLQVPLARRVRQL